MGGIDLLERAERNARQGVRVPMQEAMTVLDPETMQPVPGDGETMGEIMFRGNITMKGYLKNPEATEEAFAGGWFHTGDLAVTQPDGYVKIKDRSKDIIISGGENISSLEVEEVLYRHPAVMGAAVVAQPDESWGETPCAFIELKPGAKRTAEEMRAFLPRAPGALQGAEDASVPASCRRPRPGRSRNSCCARSRNRRAPSAEVAGTDLEAQPRRGQFGSGDDQGRAAVGLPFEGPEIGMQPHRAAALEIGLAAGVEEAFRRQSLGEQDVVAWQFDVVIDDGLDLLAQHRPVVDRGT